MYFNSATIDRRIHNGAGATNATVKANNIKDLNIDARISKFQDLLKDEHVCRIPLRYLTDFKKINFPVKINFMIKRHFETEMKRLFEYKKVFATGAAIPSPDAKIVFTKTPFIQYEQLLLDNSFRQYLETIMVYKKILRMRAQKTPIQKTHEINIVKKSLNIDFSGSNRKFDWIELSIVYDKSDKHTKTYDSYNAELAAKTIKSVKLKILLKFMTLTT